jgi:hypothetical protein
MYVHAHELHYLKTTILIGVQNLSTGEASLLARKIVYNRVLPVAVIYSEVVGGG